MNSIGLGTGAAYRHRVRGDSATPMQSVKVPPRSIAKAQPGREGNLGRICRCLSHPASSMAGVIKRIQMSDSLRLLLVTST